MPSWTDLARTRTVVLECAEWDTLLVTGPERRSWLEGLVTCQVGALGAGQATWGLSLSRQGKIQSVLWVVAAPEALWLGLAPGTIDSVEAELAKRLIMEDAELARPRAAQSWFAFHGPEAATRAAQLAAERGGFAGAIDWSGLGGAALVLPAALAPDVRQACEAELLSPSDWTRLRLERGVPEFGVDFDGRDRPHEAGLERRAVNWTKGCYLGQEVVCMQDMRGKVKRSLRLFHVAAPADAGLAAGAEIVSTRGPATAEGGAPAPLGTVTTCAFSERAQGWLALARVDLDPVAAATAAGSDTLRCRPPGAAGWLARPTEPI